MTLRRSCHKGCNYSIYLRKGVGVQGGGNLPFLCRPSYHSFCNCRHFKLSTFVMLKNICIYSINTETSLQYFIIMPTKMCAFMSFDHHSAVGGTHSIDCYFLSATRSQFSLFTLNSFT